MLTTAGDPVHWAANVLDAARSSERWHVSEVPGPVPWADPKDLAEQARLLPASAYSRLHLNIWTAAEDRLVSPEDLAACVTLEGPQPPNPRNRYVIGLDLGLKLTALVCHAAHIPPSTPQVLAYVTLDRAGPVSLTGTPARPVQDVGRSRIGSSTIGHDPAGPWQAVGLAQRLRSSRSLITNGRFSVSVGRR